jgi:uridine kinase
MPIRPTQFDQVATKLERLFHENSPKLIAIDGRAGAGKSTLGRFLAWYFNSTLLELDLFLTQEGLVHCYDEVERIIKRRVDGNRPIFVEGVMILKILERIHRPHDYLIYVRNNKCPRGIGFNTELDEYEGNFRPKSNANYVLECEHNIK